MNLHHRTSCVVLGRFVRHSRVSQRVQHRLKPASAITRSTATLSTSTNQRTPSPHTTTSITTPSGSSAATTTTSIGAAAATVAPYVQGDETHFGFSQVSVSSKEERVREVFANVADSYDVMNDLMSAGLHRYWKDYLIQLSSIESIAALVRRLELQNNINTNSSDTVDNNPESTHQKQQRQLNILDVAGGTGDVAFRMVEAAGCVERSKSSGIDPIQITICDINPDMLRVGHRRAMNRFGPNILHTTQALRFVEGNAQNLHTFPDNTFDLYTIAFGLRNVTDVDMALQEACRVLKPGGRFLCLEFAQVPNDTLRNVYDMYSFNVIPTLGEVVANDRASYQYLVESIRKFSNQQELLQRLRKAGFQNCKYTNLTFGVVAIHEGWKALP